MLYVDRAIGQLRKRLYASITAVKGGRVFKCSTLTLSVVLRRVQSTTADVYNEASKAWRVYVL